MKRVLSVKVSHKKNDFVKYNNDIENINEMIKILGEKINNDCDNLDKISNNFTKVESNVEDSLENLQEIIILKNNNKKILLGGFIGSIVGCSIFGPIGIMIGFKSGIYVIVFGILLSTTSGVLIGSNYC